MSRKQLRVEWKDVGKGTFRARFATFGVVDADKDVTFPGAFPIGKEVPISSYMHTSWMGALPVGKGVISADDQHVYVDGGFFLNTTHGRDHYETVKSLDGLQEWSYGYDVLEASYDTAVLSAYPGAMRGLLKVDPFEVSPVLKGAGVGTQTEAIKGATSFVDLPIAPDRIRSYVESEVLPRVRAWASDGSGEKDKMDWAKYRQAFFWYDSETPEDFGSYKLKFADVVDGKLVAIARGIFVAAAVIQGARGGVNIPAGDMAGVRAHIGRYYAKMREAFDDDSIVPPWDDAGKSLSLGTHAERVLADVLAFRYRAIDRAELRAKEGRRLSSTTRDQLSAIHQSLMECAAGLRSMIDEGASDSGKDAVPADLLAIYAGFTARNAELNRQFEEEFARYAKQAGREA